MKRFLRSFIIRFLQTIFWILLSFVFSLFIIRFFKFASIYGRITGIFLLIMWLFQAKHIILIGAVINPVNASWGIQNVKTLKNIREIETPYSPFWLASFLV